MRTSQKLDRIAVLALLIKERRGDTEWDDVERTEVDAALDALERVQAADDEVCPSP